MKPAPYALAALAAAWTTVGLALDANRLQDPGFEKGAAGWARFGEGFQVAPTGAKSGRACLRCDNSQPGGVTGALQIVELNQTAAAPVVVSGWSKAQGVTAQPSPNYSIYCDVEYTTDTRPGRVDLPGRVIRFKAGTHGWAFGEMVIEPEHPIESIKVYALFRRPHTGTAWFDDLYVGPLSPGPLAGSAAAFPALPQASIPKGFAEALAGLPQDQCLAHVAKIGTGSGDPLNLCLAGAIVHRGEPGQPAAAQRPLPWRFPRGYVQPPDPGPYTRVKLRRIWGDAVVDVETQGRAGGAFRYTIALPAHVAIHSVRVHGWEPSRDRVQIHRLGGRIVLRVLTETEADADRVSFHLAQREHAARPVAERPHGRVRPLRTGDGLELRVADDGALAGMSIGGRDVTAFAAHDPSAGFHVADMFGEPMRAITGQTAATPSGIVQRAQLADMGLAFAATYTAAPDRIDVEAAVQDSFGCDRALDLVLKLPVTGKGWTWWTDITTSRGVAQGDKVEGRAYPWATLTHSDLGAGFTLAARPHRPCAFTFCVEPAQGGVSVRVALGLCTDSLRPGRAGVAFSLFATDPKWGFRDAAARYYAAFPAAFRRLGNKEGGWLFACAAAKLRNPEDYAYHEAGPGGWQLDEKLGLLTCPYRIPTQRQIVFPSLPESNEQAEQWIARLSRTIQPARWRLRAAEVDGEVAFSGKHSLRCDRLDAASHVGAQQDIPLDQTEPKPIVLSGHCRADGVTGEADRDFALHADVFLADGSKLWGQKVIFNTGTHDWQAAQTTIAPGKPIDMVRLHVLMRGSHQGRAWFDDLSLCEQGSAANRIKNPSFEQGGPHAYAAMMQNCASHNREGHPYIVRRDNVGADVLPKNPIYNVVYAVNCDPNLFADREALTVGKFELGLIERMLDGNPKLDGVYLDSISGWVSRYPNYRREHFRYVGHPLTYDPRTGRPVAPGWLHTYEFMAGLRARLSPKGKVVFPNIGRGLRLPFLYFVCDVIGLEGGLRRGPFQGQLSYYRTLAYHRPVLVMDYLNVLGRPTRHATREGFERFWKWCALYGAHPSIGRDCVKAYEEFGDVYRQFREPLKRLGAAGWEPVTYAAASDGALIERFGAAESGLYFTVFNPADRAQDVRIEIDAAALGLRADFTATDLLAGTRIEHWPATLPLRSEALAILAVKPAGQR